MFRIMVLLFTLIPAIEIYVLFKFGSMFGAFNTFLIIIITGIVGAALAKQEGLMIINKVQAEMGEGKVPANEIISGLLVFGGGLLLLTPGFVTDLLGLSMIFPLTRLFYISIAKEIFKKGVMSGSIHIFTAGKKAHQRYSERSSHSEHIDDVIEADFTKK